MNKLGFHKMKDFSYYKTGFPSYSFFLLQLYFSALLSGLPYAGFHTRHCPSSIISSFCLPDGQPDVLHTRVQASLFQLH
jgi:hypothetical protein